MSWVLRLDSVALGPGRTVATPGGGAVRGAPPALSSRSGARQQGRFGWESDSWAGSAGRHDGQSDEREEGDRGWPWRR